MEVFGAAEGPAGACAKRGKIHLVRCVRSYHHHQPDVQLVDVPTVKLMYQ